MHIKASDQSDLAGDLVLPVPRTRFTVRRMMVAVFVVATLFGLGVELIRRRERFFQISEKHIGPAGVEGTLVITDEGPAYIGLKTEKGRWHEFMRRKYDYYGHHPWLPVPPDPPEPN
jgi:hypothetical protein